MQKVGGPLRDLLDRLRLTRPMEGWRAVDLWAEVVGEKVARRAQATGFRDGILYVSVDSPAWTAELTYLKRGFIAQLNRRLGEEVVRDIHLQPATPTGRGRTGRPTTP